MSPNPLKLILAATPPERLKSSSAGKVAVERPGYPDTRKSGPWPKKLARLA